MILNKYSSNGKTHPHFKFETLYINFQKDFIKCAFFKELVLNLKNMIYYFTCVALSLIHIPSPRDGLLSRMPSSA